MGPLIRLGIIVNFTVVCYNFPQLEAIHTQIALKMKNEYFLTKFCEKPTVHALM